MGVSAGGERPLWEVLVMPRAVKALEKMGRREAQRVRAALVRLSGLEDPTAPCKALTGPLTGLWRCRVGDWRVILDVRRREVVIVAVDVGHRSEVYR
jgi:mRNA interferase RelE/StbE